MQPQKSANYTGSHNKSGNLKSLKNPDNRVEPAAASEIPPAVGANTPVVFNLGWL
jgi:hypothetical protein